MNKSKADLILHPVRMKIIQKFITGEEWTTQQLSETLSNIPQATLYRHLNALLNAGLLDVVEERRNRGTVEKVYSLSKNAADLTPEDVTEASAEQHMELFLKYIASLVGEFGNYIGQNKYDMKKDGVLMRQTQLYLNDEDYSELIEDMKEWYRKYSNRPPGEGRRHRMLSTIVIPESQADNAVSGRKSNDEETR